MSQICPSLGKIYLDLPAFFLIYYKNKLLNKFAYLPE